MPWKPATAVASRGQRSIRGHISAPMPVVSEPTNHDFPMRDAGATVAAPRPSHDAAANDATLDPREPAVGQVNSVRTDSPGPDPKQPHASAPARAVTDAPHRRKTTFKSAWSRLLGRNRKAHMSEPPIKPALAKPSSQHPPADHIGQASSHQTAEQTRYASLPITEYDRALRSHSIGPDDVLAIQSVRNSLNAETRQFGKKPDASDATLAHPAAPRWIEARRFTGLTPRPASSHDRRPRLADWSEDPNEIGRAITSDVKGSRRRSRSLSVFPSTEFAFLSTSRRRSDEIRHWRESYEPAAAHSLLSPVHQTDGEEPQAVDEHGATIVEAEQLKAPAQPFIFRDVSPMKEPAGLNITEAGSLGSRLSILEVRMTRLEQLVTELARCLPGAAASTDSQRSQASAAVPVAQSENRFSTASTGEGIQDGTLPTRPPVTLSGDDSTPRSTILLPHSTSSSASRPLSLATVCGALSSYLPHDSSGTVTADQYLALVSLLETERSAREVLESQVARLGHQMNLVTKLPGYARPVAGHVPSADSSLGGTSAFDHDSEEGRWAKGNEEPSCAILGLEGEAVTARGEDDADSFADSYATPDEVHDLSSEGEQDTALKTATRALSLVSLWAAARSMQCIRPCRTQPDLVVSTLRGYGTAGPVECLATHINCVDLVVFLDKHLIPPSSSDQRSK